MDRRSFFKSLTATVATVPALAPLLLASKETPSGLEIFVIADDPQRFLPELILQAGPAARGRFFALDSHPQTALTADGLSRNGWFSAQTILEADFTLANRPLQAAAQPSFTVVKGGQVWDLRHSRLSPLWAKMTAGGQNSQLLTTVSFRHRLAPAQTGQRAALYRNGRLMARLPLDKNAKRSLETGKGLLTVAVEGLTARVDHSGCRNKICVATPPVALTGERIICAPNHFLLEIEGDPSVDTVIG
jgi:hypothetical protein